MSSTGEGGPGGKKKEESKKNNNNQNGEEESGNTVASLLASSTSLFPSSTTRQQASSSTTRQQPSSSTYVNMSGRTIISGTSPVVISSTEPGSSSTAVNPKKRKAGNISTINAEPSVIVNDIRLILPRGMNVEQFNALRARSLQQEQQSQVGVTTTSSTTRGTSSAAASQASTPASGFLSFLWYPVIGVTVAYEATKRAIAATKGVTDVEQALIIFNAWYKPSPVVERIKENFSNPLMQELASRLFLLGREAFTQGRVLAGTYLNYRKIYEESSKVGKSLDTSLDTARDALIQEIRKYLIIFILKEVIRTKFNEVGAQHPDVFSLAQSTTTSTGIPLAGIGILSAITPYVQHAQVPAQLKFLEGLNNFITENAQRIAELRVPIRPGNIRPATLPYLYVMRRDEITRDIEESSPTLDELEEMYITYVKPRARSSFMTAEERAERFGWTNGSGGQAPAYKGSLGIKKFEQRQEALTKLATAGTTTGYDIEEVARGARALYAGSTFQQLVNAADADLQTVTQAGKKALSKVGWGPSKGKNTTTPYGQTMALPPRGTNWRTTSLSTATANNGKEYLERMAKNTLAQMAATRQAGLTSSSSPLIPQGTTIVSSTGRGTGRVAVVSSTRVISPQEATLLNALQAAVGAGNIETYRALAAEAQRHAEKPGSAYAYPFGNLMQQVGITKFTEIETAFDALEAYYTSNPPRGGARSNKTQKQKQNRKSCWPKSRKQNKNQNRKNKTRKH